MTPLQVTAFCPGHISGYFKPLVTAYPETSGSCGAGIVIDSGVTVIAKAARQSSVKIYRADSQGSWSLCSEDSPVIFHLLSLLKRDAVVETFCHLPLSSGYGLSAAALLGTVHAVNILYNLNLSNESCTSLAHQVEVLFRTGLGDIPACQGGGWVVRNHPGTRAEIIRTQDDQVISALTLGPLKTASVLSSQDIMDRIGAAFPNGHPGDLDELFSFSRRFAERSGLISDGIRKVLIACDANAIPASMTMLGNGVFALGDEAKQVLSQYGEVYSLHISQTGPRILEIIP